MKTYIALLRGINVGGKHRLPMKELIVLLENLGLQAVNTYIQSGNVAFQVKTGALPGLEDKIKAAIHKEYGFEPRVMLLSLAEMEQIVAANPFPEAEAEPKSLHLYFLAGVPQQPDFATLDSLKNDNERYQLNDKVFYLHAPDGIGRSKLAEKAEKSLGVAATARNWRSVCKVMELAQQAAGT